MKNLFYTALSLIGLMGILSLGVVNAEVSEPYGHIEYTLNGNENFEAQVITITSGEDTITILDRNLGAITAGTGCEDPDWGTACVEGDATYGYLFQRGNNYGFKSTGEVTIGTDKAEWNSSYANKGYYGNTFIESTLNPYGYDYWTDSTNNSANHYDLWGGSLIEATDGAGNEVDIRDADYINGNNWKVNADTVKNRQGPCPENFHVPSVGELAKLTKMFGLDDERNNSEEISSAMHSHLKIPFAGYRYYDGAGIYYLGAYASLWSSSPISAFTPKSQDFDLTVDGDLVMYTSNRTFAVSVRCFYDFYQSFPLNLTLSFMSDDMVLGTGEVVEDMTGTVPEEIKNVTKTGYILEYRYLSGADATTGFDFENTPISGDWADESGNVYFIAQWTPITYTVEFTGTDVEGTMNPKTFTYGVAQNLTANAFTKNGYTFSGWTDGTTGYTDGQEVVNLTTTSGDVITLTADWTKIETKPSGGSSGGGGRSSSKDEKDTINNPSVTDVTAPLESGAQGDSDDGSTLSRGDTALAERGSTQTYTPEFQQAYEFAKGHGITTMPSIQEADMDGKLTRIAMAKMLSQYAINVLGQKPDETRINKFNDITDKLDTQYDSGVTLAYQLGIMGINMPDNNFRPYDEVTRAEFATALSRMLYSTPDGKPYYNTHLAKLKAEGILKNDNYKMKELRGYVMIMLMRSAK